MQEHPFPAIEATLKKAGYKVRSAFTGEEGIAEFRAGGADVVLLDMTLTEMHGTEVLSEIRKLNASVPIIVITAEENEQLREQSERLGVQDYLAKPVNYEAMLAAIKLAIEIPPEEAEIITLRLPSRIVRELTGIDPNLERAITQLIEGRDTKTMNAKR
jgi:DNA-binding response OmpR family regulator